MDDLPSAIARWIGTWRNSKGSIMRLREVVAIVSGSNDQTEHFMVRGTYKTKPGSVPSTALFPLRGFVTNDQIAFCVSFRYEGEEKKEGHSLTSWAGQILPVPGAQNDQRLDTLWHLIPHLDEDEDEDEYGWMIAWAGADKFEKLSSDPDHNIP